MNYRMIGFVLGRILLIEAVLLCACLGLSLLYSEDCRHLFPHLRHFHINDYGGNFRVAILKGKTL